MSLLKVEEVSKRFGGVQAVDKVSLHLEQGEILGVIGPNGAGKTSLFNLISGTIIPDSGRIEFDGKEITNANLVQRCHLGMGRTFQVVRPFSGMTVVENVMVPALVRIRKVSDARAHAMQLLEELGIANIANRDVDSLTLAQRKRIEVARALATEPRLLLLDEVLAGLNSREVQDTLPFVEQVRSRGVAILMIEHLVSALTSVSDRVIAIDRGAVIAEGKGEDVLNHPAVISAYMGDDESKEG